MDARASSPVLKSFKWHLAFLEMLELPNAFLLTVLGILLTLIRLVLCVRSCLLHHSKLLNAVKPSLSHLS